ncbi:MAG: hypothetical protein ABI869_03325 [Actinomycetota bacterium]
MAEKKRKTDSSDNDGDRMGADPTSKPGGVTETHVCNVAFCPIGLALSAVQPMKPEVVEHLLVAGRELFLATKALWEVRAEDLATQGVPSTFEKIDIG